MRRFVAFTLTLLFLGPAVFASTIMAGSWQSTTGSIISIPPGRGQFDLVVTHRDGQKFLLSAHWLRVGYSFSFRNEYGNTVTARLQGNRIELVTDQTGSVNYWTRRP